ncbi:hypothetical protein K502DRAFT_131410 [Neoconidiobolus thromboides FSU 785]|nr:hypothetical protein K502DRAFT_131410 [Neoconidiobolus thromboides FSU 785]
MNKFHNSFLTILKQRWKHCVMYSIAVSSLPIVLRCLIFKQFTFFDFIIGAVLFLLINILFVSNIFISNTISSRSMRELDVMTFVFSLACHFIYSLMYFKLLVPRLDIFIDFNFSPSILYYISLSSILSFKFVLDHPLDLKYDKKIVL